MRTQGRSIKVSTRCVADNYAAPRERIVEFSSPAGGGLISFMFGEDGTEKTLSVCVYRYDRAVNVIDGGPEGKK